MEVQEGSSTVETTPQPPPPPPLTTSPPPPPPAPETTTQSTSLPPVDPSPDTTSAVPPATAPAATSAPAPLSTAGPLSLSLKKKRGRPRKYGPDGSLVRPLNATPISASVPAMGGEYTPAAYVGAKMKRGRGKPPEFSSRFQFTGSTGGGGFRLEGLGDATTIALSANSTFTPHVLTVAPGEDVHMKIISFSQQGPRSICILSANGVISNVTLRQPDSSGGTLTYEGRFELLSLSGSFMPSENGGTRSRSGGMSVSLAGPDGRVVGGSVAGLLVAAGPVQIVVGSFLQSYQTEPHHKPVKKVKTTHIDIASVSSTIHSSAIPISSVEVVHNQQPKVTSGVLSFRGENWPSPLQQLPPDSRNSVTGV
ncbi:hypothetical protein LUZ60_011697 [Juncus effusus]|nr:hypothetical protein LUZ60_011697 [Juncus effusus]